MKTILGKTISEWIDQYPLIEALTATREVCWFNPQTKPYDEYAGTLSLGKKDILDAAERLTRFRPYIAKVFPETARVDGLIESPLVGAPHMMEAMASRYGTELLGGFLVKLDSNLPISGSIKARGGIYEVLKHAEALALENGLIRPGDDYGKLASDEARQFFGKYAVAVGSTGNLGLSIGIMGATFGFRVSVHMSADARAWKKALLREKGVNVVEYEDDYSTAVALGRKEAESDPFCRFVDDENSTDLFMGYAVAALRLEKQLEEQSILVDEEHPLFVYLPCGVGGGPGGVAFGLKTVFGDAVHCFFAEPTHSPAMLMGLYTGLHDGISVQDFGIDNLTAADGLAVGRPSGFVGKLMAPLMDGAYTVDDDELYSLLALMAEEESVYLEPSALAGFPGIAHVVKNAEYPKGDGFPGRMENAVHIAWATGGSMVPDKEMKEYLEKGRLLLAGV